MKQQMKLNYNGFIEHTLREILEGEEDDDDGLCEPDTEADSEG